MLFLPADAEQEQDAAAEGGAFSMERSCRGQSGLLAPGRGGKSQQGPEAARRGLRLLAQPVRAQAEAGGCRRALCRERSVAAVQHSLCRVAG